MVAADITGRGGRHLHRALSNRQIQLIAIGGAIGTGLFMGSGKTISRAGPAVVVVYAVIGFFVFFVLRAMGELLLSNLNYKSFVDFAADLLGPAAGFFVGWSYWFAWVVTGIAEIVAIVGYSRFWWPDLPPWIPASVTVGLVLIFNVFSVRNFGEIEFWFALIKIIAILALIGVGVALVAVGFVSPYGDRASIQNLWADGGFFATGLMGVVGGFQIAFFAFVGVELVGTTAAETADPRHTLPRAINAVPLRVAIFYIGALVAILMVVPWRHFASGESPFVTMFALAGLTAAASTVNFVVITSAASSANSGVFSTGRMLFGLADEGSAPSLFRRLNRGGVPAPAVLLTAPLLLTSVPLLYAGGSVIGVFTVITTVASLLFMFVWAMIVISYLVYRRRHGHRHTASTYRMPGGVVMCWAVLVFFGFVIATLAIVPDTAVALACFPTWFVLLAAGWLIVQRRPGHAEQYRVFQAEMGQPITWAEGSDQPRTGSSDMADRPEVPGNADIIAEFRANDGKVGGPFEGATLLLLHSTGAKSGAQRINPVMTFDIDGKLLIVGSYAGADIDPAWLHNLRAHPEAHIEIGTDSYAVRARELPRDERDEVYPRIVAQAPGFGGYQDKTDRVIPVVELQRV